MWLRNLFSLLFFLARHVPVVSVIKTETICADLESGNGVGDRDLAPT